MTPPLKMDKVWLERIVERIDGLEYGTVLITVHDGKIVQIDRTERKRYNDKTMAVYPVAADTKTLFAKEKGC